MKKLFLLLLLLFSASIYADEPLITLDKMPSIDNKQASIKRGAKFFATTCMSCHTLIYLRYNSLAKEAGVVYEKMPVNVKWAEGAKPPDLSLEAEVRGVDWIYTYLHSFYLDPARSTGVNNLLVPNTMMPGIIVPFQGQQIMANDKAFSQTLYSHDWEWYDALMLQKQGTMSPKQFDAIIMDVVNFLAYAAAPYHAEQVHIGWWVLGFLSLFFMLAYLLKREYWKDIK
jgi:ubiquinol-cytochrome c reductase cytochrome c1 subunit